jgi:hypothetical protein
MGTLLDRYASLTLKLLVPGGATVSIRGINETTATELVACCWAQVAGDRLSSGGDRYRTEEGNSFTELVLSGYFLSPQMPSAAIRPGTIAEAILWRLSDRFSLLSPAGSLRTWSTHAAYDSFVEANRKHIDHEGQFRLAATLASQYQLPDQLLGKRLAGIFAYRTQWGDVL